LQFWVLTWVDNCAPQTQVLSIVPNPIIITTPNPNLDPRKVIDFQAPKTPSIDNLLMLNGS